MEKIRFWRTVGEAYRQGFDLRRLFRLAGPWIIAFLALLIVGTAVAAVVPTRATELALSVTAALLMVASYGAFAVAWHRSILLGERLAFGDSFRFGLREARFLACYFATLFAALVPILVAGVTITLVMTLVGRLSGVEAIGLAGSAASVAAALVIYGWSSRFTLALPAAALDDAPPYLGRAWQRGRGNTLRLMLGTILCGLPIALILMLIASRLRGLLPEGAPLEVAIQAVVFVGNYVGLAVYVAFLSFAFEQLRSSGGQRLRGPAGPYRPQS